MGNLEKELDKRIFQLFEKVGSSDQDWYDAHTPAKGDVWDYIECIHLTPEARREVKKLVLWYEKSAHPIKPPSKTNDGGSNGDSD